MSNFGTSFNHGFPGFGAIALPGFDTFALPRGLGKCRQTASRYTQSASGGCKECKNNEAKNLIGCCGLYCGLCTKYQSKAPSRCVGCKLGEQHSWCSIWNCCVKKHGFEICIECSEIFNCAIFLRRKIAEWTPAADNLRQIKKVGLENWLEVQKERQILVEELLQNYNEGHSMSFYCKVCTRMPINLINQAIKEAKKKIVSEKIDNSDMKLKAKNFKSTIKDITVKSNIKMD